jgi:hypothetical protein
LSEKCDVVVIGAGPAGLFAAYELSKSDLDVLVLDKGKELENRFCPLNKKDGCTKCNPCSIMSGIGGSGLFSDGKLNFTPILGKTDLTEFMSLAEAQELIDETERVFAQFGLDGKTYPKNMDSAMRIKKQAKKFGIDLMLIKQKHIGSDELPKRVKNVVKFLEEKNVQFMANTTAQDFIVSDNKVAGVETDKGAIYSNYVIAAPGRVGTEWLKEQARKLRIGIKQRGIEVGVRVEVPQEIMRPITRTIYDPTFFIISDTYDDQLRTFCTNEKGFVSTENYGDFVCVNGHACKNTKSGNTNFAFLSKVVLTEPVNDTYTYGNAIGILSTTIGGGKPILQRFIDLKKGRRSTWKRIKKSYIEPTLKDVTPGDISMALPKRIVTNIIEGLERLDKLIPGITSNHTLLYAPEIKFFSTQIQTNSMLETPVNNLFVAGDGAGVSGNIVSSAATGILAARGIMKKLDL